MLRKLLLIGLALLLLVPFLVVAQQERADLSVVNRIRTEAFGANSKAMEYAFHLTDVLGPRLTGSPGYRAAGDWAVEMLTEMGLTGPHEEKWGPFGRGWTFTYYSGHMIEPGYSTLIGVPVAWTPGTNGPVTGDAIMAVIQTQADFEQFKGKLKGKIVLTQAPRDLQPAATPLFTRYTAADLADIASFAIPGGRGRGTALSPIRVTVTQQQAQQRAQFSADLANFWKTEQPALLLQNSRSFQGGALAGGGESHTSPDGPPAVILATEYYNRIARLLTHTPPIPVRLQFEVRAQFFDDNRDSFNVVADLPGGSKKGELVMVGAHLDSWHYATGATDNAVGVAVAIEVMRILKALDLKMDRTVRIGLWGGEEEGLLGSAAYVKAHFADPAIMQPTREHDNFAGYFNLDNGTGKIRGIYTQGNGMVKPIFEAWLAPFRDLGADTVTARDAISTDHGSFDAVGLPGFQFIQDPADYDMLTHHSNMDVYDRIQRDDVVQMAAVEAAFVYDAATRPEKLPRKPLPPPRAAAGRGGRAGN